MTLKSTGFNFFAKIIGGNYFFCCSSHIIFNPTSHLNMTENIESISIEINLSKAKWLVSGCYHPPSQEDQYFFNHLGNAPERNTQNYEIILLVGDLNAENIKPCLSEFVYQHNAENIVKEKTCFKSLTNPSRIDLFLINFPSSFQNTCTITTGLSDFHKIVITAEKMRNFYKHF